MKNKFLNSKNTTVISCILAVSVLILLLLGDVIVSQFIPVNPNQIYEEETHMNPEDEELPTIMVDPSYDVHFMQIETLQSVLKRIQNGETVFVFSGRSTCSPCRLFLPVLKEVNEAVSGIPLFYLDRNAITEQTEGYSEFLNLSNILKEKFSGTPFLMVFQNGKFEDYILGMKYQDPSMLKDEILKMVRNYVTEDLS